MEAYAAEIAARVVHIAGTVAVRTAAGSVKVLAMNSELSAGDLVNTQKGSSVRLRFTDGSELVLRENTQLRVESYQYDEAKPADDGLVYSMLKGGLRAVTGAIGKRGNQDAYKAKVNSATIGIRGTKFGLFLCRRAVNHDDDDCLDVMKPARKDAGAAEGLYIDVIEGKIIVVNPAGSQILEAGEYGYVGDETTPPTRLPESPGIENVLPPTLDQIMGGGGPGPLGTDRNAVCVIR
jgi:hypothetical protein